MNGLETRVSRLKGRMGMSVARVTDRSHLPRWGNALVQ
jgi:hypothetical protein